MLIFFLRLLWQQTGILITIAFIIQRRVVIPVNYYPSLACVASVSIRVIARKLELRPKKVPSFPSPSPIIHVFLLLSQLSRRTLLRRLILARIVVYNVLHPEGITFSGFKQWRIPNLQIIGGGGSWSSGSLPWIHHCQVNKRVGIYIRNMWERVRKYLI